MLKQPALMVMSCTPGNGGGDQIQVGPSPFASVIGQPSVGLVTAVNGKHCEAHYEIQPHNIMLL